MTSLVPTTVRHHLGRTAPGAVTKYARLVRQGETLPQRAVSDARAAVLRRRLSKNLQRTGDADTFVRVKVDGRAALARVVETFRSDLVWAEQAAQVAEALTAHGVDHVFVSVDPFRRRVIAVPESQRALANRALADRLTAAAFQVGPVYSRQPSRFRPLTRRGLRTKTLRVFQPLATASGALLSGAEMGCDLQFWCEVGPSHQRTSNGEFLESGTLLGERTTDALPEAVEPAPVGVVERPVDGRLRPVAAALQHPHLLQHLDPVDVVYTWVDGSDPAWQRRRDAALHEERNAPLHDLAANESRFTSRDELRYSLRSLEMYAPWVRHVFLVTDDQVPDWLDVDHSRLTVVDHAALFGSRGRLPTFNSHAIESQLHHLDGLAENYLYLNDDFFFGRPVDPSLFVLGNGLPKIFFSNVKVAPGPLRASDLPITSAAKNNRDVLADKFGRTTLHRFQHAPYSLRRSVMYELEDVFAEELAATASAPFRSPSDLSVSASLGLAYSYLVGKAVPGRLRHLYADIARADTPDRLALLLESRDRDVFCLNDHDSSGLTTQRQHDVVAGFLESYFPLPSRFEC
ncbi:stealth family protein [Microlunatus antarcticus]|uniref:Stealth protein CR4, conserved region 4 n=1 Tax=Microlunatus antarcticus TaxID=53388 RepID=A0A7W5JVG4_9ACTN|nr:stealth family protein [Microlunatus antarcticus]MBB3326950.1 hypothetical protein [Microlunatus antarcticus]